MYIRHYQDNELNFAPGDADLETANIQPVVHITLLRDATTYAWSGVYVNQPTGTQAVTISTTSAKLEVTDVSGGFVAGDYVYVSWMAIGVN